MDENSPAGEPRGITMAAVERHLTTRGRNRERAGRGEHKVSPLSVSGLQIAHSVPEEYNNMPLVNLVIALIVVGLALWLINRFIPMQSGIKTILNVVVVVAVGIWVLQATGLWGPISTYRISTR